MFGIILWRRKRTDDTDSLTTALEKRIPLTDGSSASTSTRDLIQGMSSGVDNEARLREVFMKLAAQTAMPQAPEEGDMDARKVRLA